MLAAHARLAAEHGFDASFEAYVAKPLAALVEEQYTLWVGPGGGK